MYTDFKKKRRRKIKMMGMMDTVDRVGRTELGFISSRQMVFKSNGTVFRLSEFWNNWAVQTMSVPNRTSIMADGRFFYGGETLGRHGLAIHIIFLLTYGYYYYPFL